MDFLKQVIEAEARLKVRNSLLEVYNHIKNLEENRPFIIIQFISPLSEGDKVIQIEYVDKDSERYFIKRDGYLYFIDKGEIKEKFPLKNSSEFIDYNITGRPKWTT